MEAFTLFNQPETWQQIMRNGMAMDFSWKSSALQYLELYEKALAEKQRAAPRLRSGQVVRGQRSEGSRQEGADSGQRAAESRQKAEGRGLRKT
jgi:hypothetical protein